MTVKNQIEKFLADSKEIVFIRKEFGGFGGYSQVSRGLRDIINDGGLVKAGLGIYVKARFSSIDGKPIPIISVLEIGFLALEKLGIKPDLSHATKDYSEGLSTQMPMASVINVGKSKTNRKIGFRKNLIRYQRDEK